MDKSPSVAFAVTLASISLVGPMALHIFLPLIPAIKTAFGISHGLAQFTFVLGIVVMAVSTLFYGALADRYGRRPVLLSGLSLFLLGSLISAAADSLAVLIVGRVVQAVGAGCGTTLVRAIARDAYGQANLVRAIAYLTMAYTLGPMIAPLAGGLLIDSFGWRTVFLFAFAVGTIVTGGGLFAHPRDVGCARNRCRTKRGARFPGPALEPSLQRVRAADRLSHWRVPGGDERGRGADVGCARPTGGRVRHVSSSLFPIGFFTGSLVASRLSGTVSIERMVLAGSVLLCVAVGFQSARCCWPACCRRWRCSRRAF